MVNRPGAGGSVAARAASEAAPDGYTLYQPVLSTFVALHPAASNVPLKVPGDFLPIGFVAENPMFIATSSRTFPAVSETIPDFVATGWGVLVAPLNTPDPIIQKVSADLQQVASKPDLQKKLAQLGSYTRPMTAPETTTFVHKQQNIWNPVLADIAQKQPK